jgi:protease-4
VPPGKAKGTGKKIAVVYAVGPIQSGKSTSSVLGGEMIGADTIVATLRKADQDEYIAAVVLRIDSPGGSALASDLIWREVVGLKKPLVASMGDVAASGGYYIAMGADKIFAEPATITGSIGVVGGKVALKGLYAKLGITTEAISRGRNSSLFDGSNKFTDSERKALQELMNNTYKEFTSKAAAGRKMDPAALEKLAGGQVWTGKTAKQNGLVDELGTLKDAVEAAKALAGLKPDDKTETLVLPEPKNFFELLSGDAGDDEVSLRLPPELLLPAGILPDEIRRHAARAEALLRVFQERSATIMPFWLEVR